MSAETLEYHHDKHHKAYVDNLNQLIEGTVYEGKDRAEPAFVHMAGDRIELHVEGRDRPGVDHVAAGDQETNVGVDRHNDMHIGREQPL
jgi:hypothetical protein